MSLTVRYSEWERNVTIRRRKGISSLALLAV